MAEDLSRTERHEMSEMVERVARAIEGQMGGKSIDMARAAIEAMRDPTEEMRTALCKACSTDCFAGCDVGSVWNVGIDEALK